MTRSELTALASSHGCKLVPANDIGSTSDHVILVNRNTIKNATKIQVGEYDRCGKYITEDLQSGPIYCGEWATVAIEFQHEGTTHQVAWCPRHTPHEHR